jgi:hypothetical protein
VNARQIVEAEADGLDDRLDAALDKLSDHTKELYVGSLEIEFENKNGEMEYKDWEVVKRGNHLYAGTACNAGFLDMYVFDIDYGESVDEALQEFYADLEVEAREGPAAMSSRSRPQI